MTQLKHDPKACECPLCVPLLPQVVKLAQAQAHANAAVTSLLAASEALRKAKTEPFTAGHPLSWDPKEIDKALHKLAAAVTHEADRIGEVLEDVCSE
jgi:hypothetical protein